MTIRVGSLFAGIGGFDLAAESLGWSTAWVSEIDPFACAVLAKHFPDAPNLGDITKIDWSRDDIERPDILCGGFPCQPHSLAGKRAGANDERDLWEECVRALRGLRPRYAVFENVPGLLTSEYAEEVDGRIATVASGFFGRVLRDLAESGYDAEWSVLSAAAVGAPHRRERVWIVASRMDNANGGRREQRHASEREPAELGAGLAPAGNADRAGSQGHGGEPGGLAVPAGREGTRRLTGPSNRAVCDWSDASPYRGADGTVRLIPAGAVADHSLTGREAPRADRLRNDHGSCGDEGLAESTDGAVRGAVEVSRPEPSLRALADGLPNLVAGRGDGAEEAEDWLTPHGLNNEQGQQGGEFTKQLYRYGGEGGSLWPVIASEPGRVAKLKAVGNAIVPKCAVEGPFRRIIEIEAGR